MSLGYPENTMDVDDMFCGLGETVGTQICYGDSGGPLFLEYNDKLIQVGINIWVDAYCSEEFNGFLRIQPHMAWIRQTAEGYAGEKVKSIGFNVLKDDGI